LKESAQPVGTFIFDEIRKRAEAHWDNLWNDQKPVIWVGTATCGRAAGALDVLQAVKEVVKNRNIECIVFEVGCLGHCYAEPLVIIRKPGYPSICYGHVTPVLAENLVTNLIFNDDPSLEFVLGALDGNDLIPSFSDFPRAQYEKRIILRNCGRINPDEIEHSIAQGGYQSLANGRSAVNLMVSQNI
jgi:NADH-quinone oxidoreductase subunit F